MACSVSSLCRLSCCHLNAKNVTFEWHSPNMRHWCTFRPCDKHYIFVSPRTTFWRYCVSHQIIKSYLRSLEVLGRLFQNRSVLRASCSSCYLLNVYMCRLKKMTFLYLSLKFLLGDEDSIRYLEISNCFLQFYGMFTLKNM